ncbi:MAG: Fe-S cluster assembly protein SufB, partial [Halomonas sp. HL-93]
MATEEMEQLVRRDYKEGFVTDIESDTLPPGLDENT